MSAQPRHWFQRWFPTSGRPGDGRPRRQPRRPALEQLEDRLVPATFNVLGTADAAIAAPTPTAQAGVFTVPNLRSAVQAADTTTDAAGNVINLTVAGVYRITLPGTPGETDNAAGEFAISGLSNGATNLTIQNTSKGTVVVDGGGQNRVFDINPNFNFTTPPARYTVTLTGFTIENGRASDAANPDGPNASGGGIRDQGNTSLTLNNINLTNNSATADGGGVVMENTVSTPWTLTINGGAISNNHAGDAGGGVDVDGSGKLNINPGTVITGNSSVNQGAGIWLDAVQVGTVFQSTTLVVSGATITDNVAYAADNVGGGIGNAGNGAVVILNSTVANNFSGGVGGGFGDENAQGTLVVLNSTFANNVSIGNGGGIQASGPSTRVEDSTVTGNEALAVGGGISVTSASFVLNNTIVALNLASGGNANFQGTAPDVNAAVTAGTNNFIGIGDAGLTGLTNGTNGNRVGTAAAPLNPLLGPLQNNGGQTTTEAPLAGSPVIGTGSFVAATAAGLTTDQRGLPRTINNLVDIGAVEFNPATTTTLTATPNPVAFGQAITLTAKVAGLQGSPAPTGTVTFMAGNTVLGTVALDAAGTATLTTNLKVGRFTVTAAYGGDANYAASTSTPVAVRVAPLFTPGIFDPRTATWFLRNSSSSGAPDFQPFAFGAPGWVPVTGDWTGSGRVTIGVVDPRTMTWFLSSTNPGGQLVTQPFQFGLPGWIPVVGDWAGSGHTGIGAYDPATGTWYLRNEDSPGTPDAGVFRYGAPGWTPVVGDWDGNCTTTVGVVDPRTMTWFLRHENSSGAPDAATPFQFGAPGWTPVVGDWDGNGTTTVGVVSPATSTWFLRNSNSAGAPDIQPFTYGAPGWTPVAGSWNAPPQTQGTAQPSALSADLLGTVVRRTRALDQIFATDGANG